LNNPLQNPSLCNTDVSEDLAMQAKRQWSSTARG